MMTETSLRASEIRERVMRGHQNVVIVLDEAAGGMEVVLRIPSASSASSPSRLAPAAYGASSRGACGDILLTVGGGYFYQARRCCVEVV